MITRVGGGGAGELGEDVTDAVCLGTGFGFAFGFGWTPCMGPVLFTVMSYLAGGHNKMNLYTFRGQFGNSSGSTKNGSSTSTVKLHQLHHSTFQIISSGVEKETLTNNAQFATVLLQQLQQDSRQDARLLILAETPSDDLAYSPPKPF